MLDIFYISKVIEYRNERSNDDFTKHNAPVKTDSIESIHYLCVFLKLTLTLVIFFDQKYLCKYAKSYFTYVRVIPLIYNK